MNINDVLWMLQRKIEAINPVPEDFLVSKGNYNGFEKLVPLMLNEMVGQVVSDFAFEINYGHHFPDIDLILNGERFGLELKSRNNGSWDTAGNSVFEKVSGEDYKEIFLFFGSHKKGAPQIKVKYRPYWETASAISVTHSPRFKINMDAKESVFASAEEYKKLQIMSDVDKITFLQNYLRDNTTGLKWFIPPEPDAVKPTAISALDKRSQQKVISEILILFPQDLLKPRSDYSRSAEHLIMTYFYYSNSFRDFFSASGKWNFDNAKFPQIVKRIYDNRLMIFELLEGANEAFQELAYQLWEEQGMDFKKDNFKDDYLITLDELGRLHIYEELQKTSLSTLSEILKQP